MGRPAGYQWRPLGWTEDPVPGDPAQISREAQHLASVAARITDQVSALRQIASDGTEVGEHADTIRSNASSLATQLDKLVGRYQQVSSILNSWVPDLEQAQSMSIQALDQAEGPYQQLNQTVALPSGNNMTPAEQQGVEKYHQAMQQAQGQLDDAQALLNRAIALRDSSGASHANQINNACNDGMRDHHSIWGSVESFVIGAWTWEAQHWSQLVGDICTVLEVLATIAAIAAFILAQFVPGFDVLVDALVLGGMVATGEALAGRILLAATGHGSWLDVAVDAFALATFGIGRLAGAGARALVPGAEAASRLALNSEMLTDFASDSGSPLMRMLAKFAGQEGSGAIDMISRLAQHAPALADGSELSGFWKVMMSVGGYGEEGETYSKLIYLGTRFSDLSQYATMAKALSGLAGLSAATAGVTGITATVANGLELDWGNWSGSLNIPSLHNWYTRDLEVPTGAPAGG
jgi:hypothetical protein